MRKALSRDPQVAGRAAEAAGGTILAFDYGERFVGVAVGEAGVGVAHPLVAIDERAAAPRFAAIAALIAEGKPRLLVVGLPVPLADERRSSADAEERLRAIGRGGRKHKDLAHPVAAQVILQDWLDRNAAA